ncbi:Structural maintenance of chromosomes protein like [Quillaja saponaria]|uniref:Structural maintenance of chromosomes protein like n=1 Tax=Quillaja saponaria TaxID=32244 RepID=A0AAD7L083_QUISA|nr:Structural maintenance of chromosomes protein like [Quillaja saponaria]
MITMDVKGITWVGNIYQKFEAVCLEVEEMMYEDAVKYVESQVQTVGKSVKKLYSDVMEDLLPPTSLDSEKIMAAELPTEHNSDLGVCKKSYGSLKEKPVNIYNKQFTKDSNVFVDVNKDASQVKSFNGFRNADVLTRPSSDNSVKEDRFTSYSRQCGDGNMHIKSKFGINENQEKIENPPIKTFGEISSTERDICRGSSFCEVLDENHEVPSHHDSVEVTRLDCVADSSNKIENACEHIPDVSTDHSSSDKVKSADKIEKDKSPSSSGGLPGELNGCYFLNTFHFISFLIFAVCAVLTSDVEALTMVSFTVGISMNEEAVCNRFSDNMVILSHADGWDLDAIQTDTAIEPGHETVEQVDKVKLEETCVMVNGDDLPIDPQTGSVRRPYKKKIRQAFSSRMKSGRKQEYEQLAVWYGNSAKPNVDCADNLVPASALVDPKNCESEWELL